MKEKGTALYPTESHPRSLMEEKSSAIVGIMSATMVLSSAYRRILERMLVTNRNH